jgi:hypothetical protein
MDINLSELTLYSFNTILLNLTEFTAVNILVFMVIMKHNPTLQFSKAHLTNLNINHFKIIEAVGLKIITSSLT